MNDHAPPCWLGQVDKPAFVYRHVVSFEETNVVGNVYFARHVAWQGRCREIFLKEYVPGILDQMNRDLRLVTLRVSCEYFDELRALDEIAIIMRLSYVNAHRIGLEFEYVCLGRLPDTIVARGFQEVGCMRTAPQGLTPTAVPDELLNAFDVLKDKITEFGRAIESSTPKAPISGAQAAADTKLQDWLDR